MRKMKKINGYFVVKFNDRELREWEGTALGNFGVIDAELYTGQLEIDRSVMEYDGAETIEEAVEQARGLEAELDVEEPAVTVTVIKETDEKTVENEPIDPAELFKQEKQFIERQIKSRHYPLVNEMTGAHMLHGFANALKRLDIIDDTDEGFLVFPETFSHKRETFETLGHNGYRERKVYALGLRLAEECPENDCRLYLNIFKMCREIDEQLDRLSGFPREHLVGELEKLYIELDRMYSLNYAVKQFKHGLPLESPPSSASTSAECGLYMYRLKYQGKPYEQTGETVEDAKRNLCLRLGEDPDDQETGAVKLLSAEPIFEK